MKRAIICFTRVPKPGVTKTRLLPILSGDQCSKLHTAFLADLSAAYQQVDADLFVSHTDDSHWEDLKEVFPTAKGFFPQFGADLGEKMHHALGHILKLGYESVILTGADIPLLTSTHIRSGFAALENCDVVLGPTSDGGYYLVGTRKSCEAIFRNQSYGGSSVLENTVAAAKATGLALSFAMPCDDVDTPEDLRNLPGQLPPEAATYQYLQQLKKEGVPL